MKAKLFEYDEFGAAQKKKKKRLIGRKSFIFLGFVMIMGLLFFSIFRGDISMTGRTIEEIMGNINLNTSVQITTNLTIPELELEGDYYKIEITGNEGSNFYIDGQRFSLDEGENNIVIKEFSGKIVIDDEKISYLEGESSSVKINSISREDNVKISLDSTSYDSVVFEEKIYIEEIEYDSSGEIIIRGDKEDVYGLDNEELFLDNFLGKLRIKDNKMNLDGLVKNLEIRGEHRKISVSR